MASLATEMPSLSTAETLAGVATPRPSQPSSIVGPAVSGVANKSGIDSAQSPETENINNTNSTTTSHNNSNNTISAAADSSDNQPSTPQPHHSNLNDTRQNSSTVHHPYANHHIYANSQPPATTSANAAHLNLMYPQHIYSQSNMELQQQQHLHGQQLQQPSVYPSYLNSYEQFYQQQQQQQNPAQASSQIQNSQHMDYINANTNTLFNSSDHKQHNHPYLHTPTSAIPAVNSQNSNSNNAMDSNSQPAPVSSSASTAIMSPRVVSSTSPSSSSNQMQINGSASSIGSLSAGNPSSPNSAGTPQCKKCGIMCTNESELQEHITNVHGASPYGSSGYASSPYIKEEMQQQTPPSQSQQQSATQPAGNHGGGGSNPGEILDLDSQKMLYPPAPGHMAAMIHQPLGSNDPLHGLHTMQQRAGINTWDQQNPEGLPPYLQQQPTESKNLPNHPPYYQSSKQSPYNATNTSTVIKSEYQSIIKTEFTGDTQQYISDKSFDPTAPNQQQQQQQMMPPAVSSSPSEFPSTTTGGPIDNCQQNVAGNQQFRAGNFEPPSSSSANITTGPVGGKAANWKSNEARRPKTYNCTACNKWFTSSGHLKRHYNTTLHKNAVKSSGQPDPATLPISVHHHPARDASGKAGRRGAAAAAAANAANSASGQQQQQPPDPVQPPEPPNSPQEYGGPQLAASGITPLSHYATTPSPNSIYQQQQYQQHQYMSQAQSTTNASPQHASFQQQHQNQQQTVMNGHPNALAGPSVPPTQQQTPMPSSIMRGLLNSTMSSTTIRIIKHEHLEAATIQEHIQPEGEVEELEYLTIAEVKQEYSVEMEQEEEEEHNIYTPKADLEPQQKLEGELLEDQESELLLQHQQLQEAEEEAAEALREVGHNVEHHPNLLSQIPQYQLQQHQQVITPNSSHSNMQVRSPLIISHQQYQGQLQQQMVARDTFTLTQIRPQPPQQLQPNIMEPQHYINMPLDTNTQQPPNNMLQLQQQLTTTEQQQLPPATTIPITNMVNMLPPSHPHMQQPQQQHMELQQLVNTQLLPDTINTNIPSHITTNNITSIQSYHQLQHPGSVLQPLDPTLIYPHTITGNEFLTLDTFGNVLTSDGRLIQFISTGTTPSENGQYIPNGSPPAGDLPPMAQHYQQVPTTASTTTTITDMPSFTPYSAIESNSDNMEIKYKPSLTDNYVNTNFNEASHHQQQQQQLNTENILPNENTSTSLAAATNNKRKRNPSSSSSVGANSTILPSGRIKCLPCDKEFTKICYLTQHNKSFHSGEYPFRCQKCGKRYQSEDIYVIHLGKHKTTDKAHKCDICPKQFHHKTDLRRHIEAIHTGNKQHSCDICEKSFCRKDHLRKHLETHNRPRLITKKTNNSKVNNACNTGGSFTTDFTKVNNNKSKDFTYGGVKILSQKFLNSSTNPANSAGCSAAATAAVTTAATPVATATAAVATACSNETNSLSSSTNSLPSPLMLQQINDVAGDDQMLEGDFAEYDGHNIEENDEYFSAAQY